MRGQCATAEASLAAPSEPVRVPCPLRVMIVDDSAVVRGLVSRWTSEEPGLIPVARHPNGKLAVDDIARSAPDVVVLDIDMPVMDGLEALPLLLAARPEAKVLVVSTLTKRNAEISFRALSLGALDYVPKPETNRDVTMSPSFRTELIRKIKAIGFAGRRVVRPRGAGLALRPFSLVPPRIIAVASSTGGPEALAAMLAPLAPELGRAPVVVAQHMPPMFTAILAERLSRETGREAREGQDKEPLKPGTIYVAPGDRHMTVTSPGAPKLRLNDDPPVHFCRPAADPLFASVARTFGPASLGIVLTGMGYDSVSGARKIAAAGGSVMAQDEDSSVVWGMPGAVAASGLCSTLLPPAELGAAAAKLMRGVRP